MLTIEQLIKELFGATLDSSAIKALLLLPTATPPVRKPTTYTQRPQRRVIPVPNNTFRECFANKGAYFSPSWQNQRVRRVG